MLSTEVVVVVVVVVEVDPCSERERECVLRGWRARSIPGRLKKANRYSVGVEAAGVDFHHRKGSIVIVR